MDYLVELTKRTFEDEAMMLAEYELTLFAARDSEVADALHEWDAAMIAELAKALEMLGMRAAVRCGEDVAAHDARA